MAALAAGEGGPPPAFSHPQYEVVGEGLKIQRRADAAAPTSRAEHDLEEESLQAELKRFMGASMIALGFKEAWIPDEEASAKCPIYVSNGWEKAPRLLMVIINQVP